MPTPTLPKRLAALVALGALAVGSVPPSHADTTLPAPAAASQSVVLQHATPGDIIKTMHWDDPAHYPAGVALIQAVPRDNTLSVRATTAGRAKVREIAKALDILPRQVQIAVVLVQAKVADVDAAGLHFDLLPAADASAASPQTPTAVASGPAVATLLAALKKQGRVMESPVITTTNNAAASITLSGALPSLPTLRSSTFMVQPRVNSDETVTLSLHPQLTFEVPFGNAPDGTPQTETRNLAVLRTGKSGETQMLTGLGRGATPGGATELLLFVTPTLLPVQ